MSHPVRLERPDKLYGILLQQAAVAGRRVEDVVVDWLTQHTTAEVTVGAEESHQGQEEFERWFGAVKSGNPDAGDNERIDADLSAEYARGLDEKAPK